jgi:2'-hydroxyisoflavone reductase
MRLLVLGGTVFLGRAVARQALAAGHDVTCAARGTSGKPVDGARFVHVDRDDPRGLDAVDGEFDAVVDVARLPDHVRHALPSLKDRVGHFTFVSSGSVYSDAATPRQRVDTASVMAPAPRDDEDPLRDAESYGACKVTCENLVVDALGDRAFVCRAGLIVGPEDPTGRFDYWVRRVDRGGEILVPGTPDDEIQFVDVRDLTEWILAAAQEGLSGTFDGIAPPLTQHTFLTSLIGDGSPLTYVPQEFLLAHKVAHWSGPRALPFWLPRPEMGGFLSRDVSPSLAAGLTPRPFTETVRDTLRSLPPEETTAEPKALTPAEEAEILTAWHASAPPA